MLDTILTFVATLLVAVFAMIMLLAGVETWNGAMIEPLLLRRTLLLLIPIAGIGLAFLRARRSLRKARAKREPADSCENARSAGQARPAADLARRRTKAAGRDVAAQMVAESQARAKRSDDAHRAKIRAHVERKAPPTSDAGRAAIALAARACLAIRHVFPPRHPQRSMSFFGSVPLAPDDLDWPMIHNRKGLLEPLTFMGQVDLGALPDGPARSLLPAHGYLYFFAPMSGNFDGDASHFVVRYVEGKARKDWGPQHNPGFLEPIDGAENARYRYPWLTWHDKPEKVYPRFYPRIEIELGWLEDVAEVEEGDPDAGDGFPWEVAKQRRRQQLVAFHGAPVSWNDALSAHAKPTDRLWIPFEGFPTNRRTADVLLGYLKSYIKEETIGIKARLDTLPARFEDPEGSRLSALLERYAQFEKDHWRIFQLATTGEAQRGNALDENQRTELLALLEELRAGALPEGVLERHYMHKRLPMVLNEWIARAAVEGAESALTDPDGIAQLPDAVVEALRYRHSVLRDPDFSKNGSYAQHQMLGRGVAIQDAAELMAPEHILLLQLRWDNALDWHMGDAGAAQYWIRPADLAARRFENTVLTFESH
ncbi:DUF1963 domain-containing protein [Mesorhizobium sp. WSM3859]|uniref:DUF1963 domain-containing protein n=1 Tax=Mesorhizobium sp. WSM3859 TaxID=2029402 RepID=UPI000BAEA931|nr:DUF1963 domain-containing protein [Mesorhizobium sp. WSM3859]PBC11632.1 hypothetical protein CK230_06290 [Mesorhizobium sp. WSM3859]